MIISVLLEPVSNDGFRAATGEPFSLSANGATRDEALSRLREKVNDKLDAGVEVISLDVTPMSGRSDSLRTLAGDLETEPIYDEWQNAIQAYRESRDREDAA